MRVPAADQNDLEPRILDLRQAHGAAGREGVGDDSNDTAAVSFLSNGAGQRELVETLALRVIETRDVDLGSAALRHAGERSLEVVAKAEIHPHEVRCDGMGAHDAAGAINRPAFNGRSL